MSKLSSKLGAQYANVKADLRIKSFELGGHTFKVKIPLAAESDAIYLRITSPDPAVVEQIYAEMTTPLLKFKEHASEEFQFLENDIVVSGRSMREAARNKAMTEARVTEYVRMLCAESPDNSLADITYADIQAEWPMSVQLAIVEKIGEIISPTYKESRGN